MTLQVIPARSGKATHVMAGQTVRIINTFGAEVVHFWAFNAGENTEFMSLEHTRAHMLHVTPRVGDILCSNRRRPILTLLEDTSGGVHDTQIAACDRHPYARSGVHGHHDNCEDNLIAAFKELALIVPEIPAPFNLFMNIPIQADGTLSFEPPVCKPGDYMLFRAEMDVIVVFSACPQDIPPINRQNYIPSEAHFEILLEL